MGEGTVVRLADSMVPGTGDGDAFPGPVLVIESSTYRGSVAVIEAGIVLAEREVAMRGANEERLMPAVADALAATGTEPSALAAVVCGAGPGSFTSLRIGAAIAKGIALAHALPLHAVPSLLLVVAGGGARLAAGSYLVVADALRGEWFVVEARVGEGGDATLLGSPTRMAREAAERMAAERRLTLIGPAEGEGRWPHARGAAPILDGILRAGPESLDAWEPGYGRLAEAQVKWEAAHGRALPAD